MNTLSAILKLASRNLLRNRRRSAVTVLAAMLGFAAVNVFAGFTTYLFVNLRESFIYGLGNGHIIIYKEGYREKGASDPAHFLLPGEVYQTLVRMADKDDRILLASGRLDLSGQLDTGNTSNIFMATAVTPSHGERFYQASKSMPRGDSFITEGKPLRDDNPNEIGITSGVRKTLGLTLGSTAVLMARTVDGQVNTVDVVVKNVFDAPNETLDGTLINMPLALAQELYQTESVGSVSILLRDSADISTIEQLIRDRLGDSAKDLRIQHWDKESELYRLTRNMFDMMFGIVFLILVVIVAMSVMNTMGMAVLERTTEIGTLRAVGLKRSGVIRLFAAEGALLGFGGVALGSLITVVICTLIYTCNPTWTPPTLGRAVPLEIRLEPVCLFLTGIALVLLTLAASIVPARRASNQGIVEALGHT